MSTRKLKGIDLKDALASAEDELAYVLKRAEQLREWITVTKKLCAKNTKVSESEGTPVTRSRRTKTTGLIQHVMEVLQAAGGPMHVDDILKKLTEHGYPVMARNPKATIAVALSRRTDQFRKTAPNTFGMAFSVSPPFDSKAVTLVS